MSRKGVLYVMHHPTFCEYGEDVYKLGWTTNIKGRKSGYRTSFLGDVQFKYVSEEFCDGFKAERILFYFLRRERCAQNREFFTVKFERVKGMMKKLEMLEGEGMIERIYRQVCVNIVPQKIREMFRNDEEKIEAELSKWELEEWNQNMPINKFLERFRFKPANPERYYAYGYVEPEVEELNRVLYKIEQSCDQNTVSMDGLIKSTSGCKI